jgi:hypothetical protein
MVLQLNVEIALPERRGQGTRTGSGTFPVTGQQAPRYFSMPAARQRHQAVRVPGEQLMGEPWRALGAGQVRVAGEATQAAVAAHVARDQYEVRAQLAGTHATQVLAAWLATARRTQAFDRRLDCLAVGGAVLEQNVRLSTLGATRPLPPSAGDDESCRICGHGIEQLHLHADDGAQACLVSGGGEPDRSVETLVVRQRQRAETKLDGALGQVVHRRSAVEEREVGVAMEFGEGARHPPILERMF